MQSSHSYDIQVGGFGLGKYFTTLSGSWSLQQMSIHAPSEHTWGGTHLPLEIQLVHVGSADLHRQQARRLVGQTMMRSTRSSHNHVI